MEHLLGNEWWLGMIEKHINEISLSGSETEKENILDLIEEPMNEDERKIFMMVEG